MKIKVIWVCQRAFLLLFPKILKRDTSPRAEIGMFVDGKSIGTLLGKILSGVGFKAAGGDGMYVDDVEVFYEN